MKRKLNRTRETDTLPMYRVEVFPSRVIHGRGMATISRYIGLNEAKESGGKLAGYVQAFPTISGSAKELELLAQTLAHVQVKNEGL